MFFGDDIEKNDQTWRDIYNDDSSTSVRKGRRQKNK